MDEYARWLKSKEAALKPPYRKLLTLSLFLLLTVLSRIIGNSVTATGLDPDENVTKYGIPAVILPFSYPVPDGMISDDIEKQAMITAKIDHLEATNEVFWGRAPGPSGDMQLLFKTLWNRINRTYPLFGGLDLDWEEFYAEFYPRIGNASSYGEYAYILTAMAYKLEEVHVSITPGRFFGKERSPNQQVSPNISLDKVPVLLTGPVSKIGACITVTPAEELVVYQIWEGSPNPYKLNIGDEIIGYNGVPWADWISKLESAEIPLINQPAGTESAQRYLLLRSVMSNSQLFEKINLTRGDSDRVETMEVQYLPIRTWSDCEEQTAVEDLSAVKNPHQIGASVDDDNLVIGLIEPENIGYLAFKVIQPSPNILPTDPQGVEFAHKFEGAILSLMDTEGLIIDLRNYLGGMSIEVFYRGLSHLFSSSEEKIVIDTAVRDPNSKDREALIDTDTAWGDKNCSSFPPADPFRDLCTHYPKAFGPGPAPFPTDNPDLHYDYPILVLTGPDCISACDWLVQLLGTFPEVTFIGRDPNGSLSAVIDGYSFFRLGSRADIVPTQIPTIAFYFRGDDPREHLSRRENIVDQEVWYTKEDIIRGVDTVRTYAIQWIKLNRTVEK